MKKLILIILLFSTTIFAQKVKVLDKNTNEPIVNAQVFNKLKEKQQISDIDGIID